MILVVLCTEKSNLCHGIPKENTIVQIFYFDLSKENPNKQTSIQTKFPLTPSPIVLSRPRLQTFNPAPALNIR
jgi:hypothetical protein